MVVAPHCVQTYNSLLLPRVDHQAQRLLLAELQLQCSLRHPHIVHVFGGTGARLAASARTPLWILLERCAMPLPHWVSRRPLDLEDVLRIAHDTFAGLTYVPSLQSRLP